MPFGIGPTELIIVLVLAFLVFGPKRLPQVARSAGRGMREFKDSVSGLDLTAEADDRSAPATQLAEGSSLEAVPTATTTTASEPSRA